MRRQVFPCSVASKAGSEMEPSRRCDVTTGSTRSTPFTCTATVEEIASGAVFGSVIRRPSSVAAARRDFFFASAKDLFTEHGRIEHSMAAHFELPSGLPFLAANDHHLRGEEAVRRRQNLLEALRAFQTVMVLDPTNREARLCMAACLQNPVMGRLDEAREYYRQILEEPVDDKWVTLAKQNLLYSFDGEGPWGEQPWFARAAAQSQNPAARAYFQEVAERTAKSINYESTMIADRPVETEPADIDAAQAKTNLLKDVQAWKEGTGHRSLYAVMETFANAFGTNSAGASALVDFLPKMEAAFPEFRASLPSTSHALIWMTPRFSRPTRPAYGWPAIPNCVT
jgi:hypothetical protein